MIYRRISIRILPLNFNLTFKKIQYNFEEIASEIKIICIIYKFLYESSYIFQKKTFSPLIDKSRLRAWKTQILQKIINYQAIFQNVRNEARAVKHEINRDEKEEEEKEEEGEAAVN